MQLTFIWSESSFIDFIKLSMAIVSSKVFFFSFRCNLVDNIVSNNGTNVFAMNLVDIEETKCTVWTATISTAYLKISNSGTILGAVISPCQRVYKSCSFTTNLCHLNSSICIEFTSNRIKIFK